jgi:hypothetical protein
MSKFIKLIPIIFLAVLVNACCCSAPKRYEIHVDELYTEKSGNLILVYRLDYTVNKNGIQKFAKLNTETYKWEASEVVKKVIADEEITTLKGKTIVKNGNGAVLFEQPVPSISDIESQTKISLPNSQAYYEYFRSGKDYLWDRKTIIINVGINKKVDGDYYNFSNIQSFLAEYDERNSLWNIKYLKEIAAERGYYYDNSDLLDTNEQQLFFNSDISLCHRQVSDDESAYIYDNSLKCLVKYDDGEVSLQKLYGEILPAEYSGIIKELYESNDYPPDVYFDENQNLYAFYNNTDEAKGKYFYFEMYKPDNPTVAQHKQKIYWD